MIALLVVRPGPLQDGLNALLYAVPEIRLVAQANDADAAFDFCQRSPAELMILEIKPGDHKLLARMGDMKVLWPQMQVVALIHDESDRKSAEISRADLVMAVGIPAADLRVGIGEMAQPLADASCRR